MTENDKADDSTENEEFDDLFSRRPLDELHVSFMGDPDDWPVIKRLARDVNEHGECHLTVEEHDNELEARVGTTVFDFDGGLLSIKTEVGYDNLRVSMSHIVSWHRPHDPFHT